jgi:S-DNA-T family DNA segregation ATPase FtsK/SpoIIIE
MYTTRRGARDVLDERRTIWNVLPHAMQRAIAQIFWTAIGVTLAGFGLAIALSLASYSVTDPSLNAATGKAVTNLLGAPGAIFADLTLQVFGAGAVLLVLPMVVWGWWLIVFRADAVPHRPLWLHTLAWSVALVGVCLTAACLPVPASWSLMTGLGGLVGDGFLSLTALPLASTGAPAPFFVTGLLAGSISLGAMAVIGGLKWRDVVLAKDAGVDAFYWSIDAVYWLRGTLEDLIDSRGGTRERVRRTPHLGEGEGGDLPSAEDLLSDQGFTRLAKRRASRKAARAATKNERIEPDVAGNITGPITSERIRQRQDVAKGKREKSEAQTTFDLEGDSYKLPPLGLLAKSKGPAKGDLMSEEGLEQNARLLEDVLQDFGVRGEIIEVRPGPVVTLYELQPAPGIKSSRVIGLADDIARSMSAISARVAVVPGRNVIGIELPNQRREMVYLRDLLSSREFEGTNLKLPLALGKDIGGDAVISDITTMPHLLVAGTTGAGKSVAINTMILSLLYRFSPAQVKMIMIDPKMLELSVYDGIPHLLSPVVTDPRKAIVALKWVVREMEDRYRNMSKLGVRNVSGFNERVTDAIADGEELTRSVQTGFNRDTGEPIIETEKIPLETMPYIVVIIDEMADLMMVAGKDIENAVQRLAQMARAAGIHVIMATQRPSVDVITGTIKANFPTRISFQVTSKIDSRTILGEQGAEQLLGQGDMLYMAGGGRINRVHGPFVSDTEVEKVVRHLRKQGRPAYLVAITEEAEGGASDMLGLFGQEQDSGDELYDRAVAIVAKDRKASTSYIQRKLQIGYNRAARIIEKMEDEGVVSQASHAGKREVLVDDHSEY